MAISLGIYPIFRQTNIKPESMITRHVESPSPVPPNTPGLGGCETSGYKAGGNPVVDVVAHMGVFHGATPKRMVKNGKSYQKI